MSAGEGVTILQGDCRETLKTLPAESVHCCVTSPPYWGLRSYVADGSPLKRYEIGLEPTPEAHIAALLEVFKEVKRVLRADGTVWLNYGDCYACAPNGRKAADIEGDDRAFRDKPFSTVGSRASSPKHAKGMSTPVTDRPMIGLKPKDLVGMPWRVALALQADGWWLRSDIIWSKRNPMPESVTDRPTRAHEYLFLLAKAERYFYDADAIREAHTALGRVPGNKSRLYVDRDPQHAASHKMRPSDEQSFHPAGRNRRTVWEINTQPTPEAHFATFPEALVEPCIMAGTSDWGCCPECGAPWARVTEKGELVSDKASRPRLVDPVKRDGSRDAWSRPGGKVETVAPNCHREKIQKGWRPTCRHPYTDIELVPAVVLDPFGGSGTVARVASRLGRRSILCELNPEYIDIAHRRTAQRGLEL